MQQTQKEIARLTELLDSRDADGALMFPDDVAAALYAMYVCCLGLPLSLTGEEMAAWRVVLRGIARAAAARGGEPWSR